MIVPEKVVFRLLLPMFKLLGASRTTPFPSIEPTLTVGSRLKLNSKVPSFSCTRDVPPVECPPMLIRPPSPPCRPGIAMRVEWPVVEVSTKPVTPPCEWLKEDPSLTIVQLPALELRSKTVTPGNAPLTVGASFMNMALPAFELSKKSTRPPNAPLIVPPLLVKVPLPAVDLLEKNVMPPKRLLTVLPLFIKIALPAVELSKKSVWPARKPIAVGPLVMIVLLPAVELSENFRKLGVAELTVSPFMVKTV